MLFKKNLSINKLLVLGVAISTLCASSNAMDNYGSLYNTRYSKHYNNLSSSLNRTNINGGGGSKYKISNSNYTDLHRDGRNIKVPTQSNNKISRRVDFTIKATKDNIHEMFLNIKDSNKKATDMHNYLFRDGGTKRIDGTYDNSKKLIKGQYEIKTEIKKNNKDIKEFNKNMHNNLCDLEQHISKLIRNNQNNNNTLVKKIDNNQIKSDEKFNAILNDNETILSQINNNAIELHKQILNTKKNIYNISKQQQENRNEIMKDFYDKFNETNKKLNDNITKQQENTNTISQKIDNQTKTIIEDANNKILESDKEELKMFEEIHKKKDKDIKEIQDKKDKIHEYYNNELKEARNKYKELQNERLKEKDEYNADLKNIHQKQINLQEKTNDAILKNLQDSNEKKLTNQHIKNIDKMMHIVNNNYIQSNINNKVSEFLLEKERLDMIERRNSLLFQPNNNQNIIPQNINQYQLVNNQYRRDNNNFGSVINREVVSDNYIPANRESIYNYANNIRNENEINNNSSIANRLDQSNQEEDKKENNINKNRFSNNNVNPLEIQQELQNNLSISKYFPNAYDGNLDEENSDNQVKEYNQISK